MPCSRRTTPRMMSCSANFTINSTCYLGRGRQYSLLEKNVLTRRTPQLMTGGPRRKRCTAPLPKPPWQNPQPSALGLPWPTAGIAAPLATTNREHVEGRELAPADMMDFTAVDGDGTRQESQMIDLVCAWCDVDARVFYRLKRAKYLVCNIYDATLKIIAVAKVKANIVIHICSSIAWQAGARPGHPITGLSAKSLLQGNLAPRLHSSPPLFCRLLERPNPYRPS